MKSHQIMRSLFVVSGKKRPRYRRELGSARVSFGRGTTGTQWVALSTGGTTNTEQTCSTQFSGCHYTHDGAVRPLRIGALLL